jgi:uncharacterized membrane protein
MNSTNTFDEWIVANQEADLGISRQPDTTVENVHSNRKAWENIPDDNFAYTYLTSKKTGQLIWLFALVLEILIAFRIFLKAIAANTQAGFARFVYGVTKPFLAPFSGLISNPSISESVLEFSSLIALVVYALLFWLIIHITLLFWNR